MSENITDAELLPAETPSEDAPLPASSAAIVKADPSAVLEAFAAYREIQNALDQAMPDCLIEIRGRQFRKKNYWRGIATAFNLSVEMVSEKKETTEDGDWGYIVTYRAVAPNGRTATGDGSCFASEKAKGQDTIHNVRSHAHTRAFNRAVSNLVGFGEVSAEEINDDGHAPARPQNTKPTSKPRFGKRPEPSTKGEFDKPLGFGKFKHRTWREMTEGIPGGERHSYLEWLAENSDRDDLRAKAKKCLQIIERNLAEAEAQAEPYE